MKAIKLPCFPPRQISYCIYEYDTFNRRMELESPSLHWTLLHSSRPAIAVCKQSLVQSCVLCARITGNVCLHWTPPTLHRLLFCVDRTLQRQTGVLILPANVMTIVWNEIMKEVSQKVIFCDWMGKIQWLMIIWRM